MSAGRAPIGRASIGTAVVLIAIGAVLVLAIDVPAAVEKWVDVLDLGLILVWSGLLLLLMQVVMHRRPGPRRRRHLATYGDEAPELYEHDVHRPGYAGQTRRFPTIRDR